MKIGLIGLGKMGEALVKGLPKGPKYKITASTRSEESATESAKRTGLKVVTDNKSVVEGTEIVILCVKPHQAAAALKGISFTPSQLLISIVASVTTEKLSGLARGRVPIIRAMPNTPCLIGEGMTVLAKGPHATDKHLEIAEQIFQAVGKTAVVEESLMDGVTGLSGCGPAYVYMMIEALSEAGVKVGLPRKTATLLAAQTMMGASKMVLSTDAHPAALKDEVTTPAGCTIDGLMALEEGKLRVTLIKAVLAAAKRSSKLGG